MEELWDGGVPAARRDPGRGGGELGCASYRWGTKQGVLEEVTGLKRISLPQVDLVKGFGVWQRGTL